MCVSTHQKLLGKHQILTYKTSTYLNVAINYCISLSEQLETTLLIILGFKILQRQNI